PTSLIWPGHEMAMPCAVPPKCEGTCFTHLNGVSKAHAQGAAKCGKVLSEPQNGYQRYCAFTGTGTPLKVVNSFGVPLSMPSALAPLSPLMYMIKVLLSSPRSSTAWITRPISWSVYARYAA